MLGVGLGAAALLGAALCPTDPVLASSVVTGGPAEEDLPARDRQILSLESGANDGLALPLVLVAVALAGPLEWRGGRPGVGLAGRRGDGVGAALGWLGGRALKAGEAHGSTDPGPLALFTVVLAFDRARSVRADPGRRHPRRVRVRPGVQRREHRVGARDRRADRRGGQPVPRPPAVHRVGAALPWAAWHDLGWRGPALAVAVLLVRRLPVLLLLRRPLRLGWADAVHLGWFGPIGVSALFYLALEAERVGADPVVLAAGSLVVVIEHRRPRGDGSARPGALPARHPVGRRQGAAETATLGCHRMSAGRRRQFAAPAP